MSQDAETVQMTVALIKPDAVAAGHTAPILARIAAEGFSIVARQDRRLTPAEAAAFYAEHAHEAWFDTIVAFMSSGPLIVLVLQAPDAINRWRAVIGHRWPPVARQLDPACLRALFGTEGTGTNAVHGSDSPEAVARELALFGLG